MCIRRIGGGAFQLLTHGRPGCSYGVETPASQKESGCVQAQIWTALEKRSPRESRIGTAPGFLAFSHRQQTDFFLTHPAPLSYRIIRASVIYGGLPSFGLERPAQIASAVAICHQRFGICVSAAEQRDWLFQSSVHFNSWQSGGWGDPEVRFGHDTRIR